MNPLLLSIWQIADYMDQDPIPRPKIPKDLQITIPASTDNKPRSNVPNPQPSIPTKPARPPINNTNTNPQVNPPISAVSDKSEGESNYNKILYDFDDDDEIMAPELSESLQNSQLMSDSQLETIGGTIIDMTEDDNQKQQSEEDVDMLRPSRRQRKPQPKTTEQTKSRSRSRNRNTMNKSSKHHGKKNKNIK